MDFQPRPRRNTNIDGFIQPQKKQTHAYYLARPETAAQPQPAPAAAAVTMMETPSQPVAQAQVAPVESVAPAPLSPPPTAGQYPAPQLPPSQPLKKRPVTKRRWKKRVARTSIVVAALILMIGGWVGSRMLINVDKVFHGNLVSDVQALSSQTRLDGESSGRVNILLAGDSADQPGHGGEMLTDSILLLSINTQNHTAFLLSIPRDLWVYLPGNSYPGGSWQKINAANEVTNFSMNGYPSGGMGELSYVVQHDLGIPVDYYGVMDYGAFRDSVDAVGGIRIDIQSPDPRGLYDPNTNIKLPNGWVNLDGQEALNLARARGDGPGSYGFPDSDFDRTQHQRQMFIAVAEKAKTLGVVSNPLKVSDLFNALGNNFQTDMTLSDVLRLITITHSMNLETSIQSYALSSTMSSTSGTPILQDYTDPGTGEEALIPTAGLGNYSGISSYYQQLVTMNSTNNPIAKEAPTVEVLNGSDVDGLAAQEAALLTKKGFDVVGVTDATAEYPNSMIIDTTNGEKPTASQALSQFMGADTTTATTASSSQEAGEASGYDSDYVVVLGQNWDNTKITGSSTTSAN